MNNTTLFTVQTYDRLYTELKRSSLDWNAKALITHIINWQDKTDKKTGKPLVCTQSNATIADELGMSHSTMEKLITRLNKETTFFCAEKKSQGKKTGGYYNSTKKTIDMVALIEFLKADEAVRKAKRAKIACEEEEEINDLGNKTGINQDAEVNQTDQLDQQVTEQEQPVEEEPLKSEQVAFQQQESYQPVNLLKYKTTKEKAFSQLDYILDSIEGWFMNKDHQVEADLRMKLMTYQKLPQEKICIYNEWITDFMMERVPFYREAALPWIAVENEKSQLEPTSESVPSLDDYILP